MQVGFSTLNRNDYDYSIKLGDGRYLVHLKEDATDTSPSTQKDSAKQNELSKAQKQQVEDLQARDTEVRAHETAHQSSGASTGAASFSYQKGPDGRMYAIGGEVGVSFKEGSTPQESIQNARAVIAAAMAPANPSPQDYSVASSAKIMEMKAMQQLANESRDAILGKEAYQSSTDIQKEPTSTLDVPA